MTLAGSLEESRLDRAHRVRGPLITIGALSAATLALHLRDPHQSGTWGFCPLYAATGIYCPGCGGLRAVNDMTDGHLGAALSSNVLVAVGVPIATVWLAVWFVARWRGTAVPTLPKQARSVLAWAGALLALVFTIARNTPAGAWLAP